MKRNEFKNGDIVVLRDGCLGLFLTGENVFIYQHGGYDYVEDMYTDELTSEDEETDFDVMQVFRAESGVISFYDYMDGDLIFEREQSWQRPGKKERKAIKKARKAMRKKEKLSAMAAAKASKNDHIKIIAQAFYGNRTGTEIRPEDMDRFILGHLDSKLPVTESIDRTIIQVPDTDGLVIIYNKFQEQKIRNKNEKRQAETGHACKPLASIPENNIEIFSRCIVCRMNPDGSFGSLTDGDYTKCMKYLAK